jgi:hypothetical protein
VDAIALDMNFFVRTLFAVLIHIFIYSYLRQKSLLMLSGSTCCTLASGACHALQELISGPALLEKNIRNITSPNVFLAKYINLITLHQYRQHCHKFGNS